MSLDYTPDRCPQCGSSVTRFAPLTRRQRQIYDYIATHLQAHGFAPSFEEIAAEMGYASLATVHEHLTGLERRGWIRRRAYASRSIELVSWV